MKVSIYGSDNCGFCTKAKQFCEDSGIEYDYYLVPEDEKLIEWFKECGFKTVPQIFLHKDAHLVHVGGYEELLSQFMD